MEEGADGGLGSGVALMGQSFGWTHPSWEEARGAVGKGINEPDFVPGRFWKDAKGRIFQIKPAERLGQKMRVVIEQIVPDLSAPERILPEEFEREVLGLIAPDHPLIGMVLLKFVEYKFSGQDSVLWEREGSKPFKVKGVNSSGTEAREKFARIVSLGQIFGLEPLPGSTIFCPTFL